MNSSLVGGLASGCAIVLFGAVVANLVAPPPISQPALEHSAQDAQAQADVAQAPDVTAPPQPEPVAPPPIHDMLADAPTAPDETQVITEDTAAPDPQVTSEMMPERADPVASGLVSQIAIAPPTDASANPATDTRPVAPRPETATDIATLPEPFPAAPSAQEVAALPQIPRLAPDEEVDAQAAPPVDMSQPDQAEDVAPDAQPASRFPQIAATDAPAPLDPAPTPEMVSALERYSLYDGSAAGRPKMAVILNDPGLPTALRRSLASLAMPVTIALNPLDPSATDAAQLYRAAGREVVILAGGLPQGATAADVDINMSAFLDALPEAGAVMDVPRDGFARNSRLLGDILPLLAADGHGLLTFSGGLSQAERAAQAAAVAHAEVFRVLDANAESVFTIRRFLDRALFQASQIGHVIVYGDASNDATIDALSEWIETARLGQVALTPVSAILLGE